MKMDKQTFFRCILEVIPYATISTKNGNKISNLRLILSYLGS